MNSQIKRSSRLAFFSMLFLLSGGARWALGDVYTPQPTNKHSDICCFPTGDPKDGKSVVDTRFGSTLLGSLGKTNFQSLIITFAECYGGGMIDDVFTAFAGSTNPISMTSGSLWNQQSGSAPSTPGGTTNNGFSRWSQSYFLAHPGITTGTNKNSTESNAYNTAIGTAPWKNANPARTSQFATTNNGGNLVLGSGVNGSGAGTYRAILFVGNPTGRPDYWNDIVRQYNMLIAAGYPASNIVVLFGNGMAPTNAVSASNAIPINGNGTRTNLLAQLQNLPPGTNTQFYIYIGDHGSPDTGGDALTKLVVPSGTQVAANTFYFDPLLDDDLTALSSPQNTSGPYLEMTVTTTGSFISSNYMVYLNGIPVNGGDNSFVYGTTNQLDFEFPISSSALNLSGSNEVWFTDSVLNDPPVDVELYLSMGDIATLVEYYQPVLNITRTGNVSSITFAAQSGVTNVLQGTYSLQGFTKWATVQSIVGANGTVTLTDSDPSPVKFYRVLILP